MTVVPRYMQQLAAKDMTARRAGGWIAVVTIMVTIAAGIIIWIFDRKDFPDVWLGLWWAVQTVTTVGYGDVTPTTGLGRAIGTIVMLTGIAFVTVVTAAITAVFVESARARLRAVNAQVEIDRHSEILERLERLEQRLER